MTKALVYINLVVGVILAASGEILTYTGKLGSTSQAIASAVLGGLGVVAIISAGILHQLGIYTTVKMTQANAAMKSADAAMAAASK